MVFMNTFHVAPDDVDGLMEALKADGEFMKRQPGYRSTQLHRGTAGSTTFINEGDDVSTLTRWVLTHKRH
jgi:heme-degrading monooxygenase HmoA